MRFVDIQDLHGNVWPVNPDRVCYLRQFGENTQVVFGTGLNGLHQINARGNMAEVREKLEAEPHWPIRYLMPPIGGAMAPPPAPEALQLEVEQPQASEMAGKLLEAGAEVARKSVEQEGHAERPPEELSDEELPEELEGLSVILGERRADDGPLAEALHLRIAMLESEQKRRAPEQPSAETKPEAAPKEGAAALTPGAPKGKGAKA